MLNNKNYTKKKNAFYKRKDIFYKKKSGFNNGTTIIIGLLFLVGIMIGLVLKEDSKVLNTANIFNNDYENKTSKYSQGKTTPSRGNSINEHEYNDLEEVPDLNDSTVSATLTKDEINEIKNIINSDTTGLYTLVNKENLLSKEYMPGNLVIPNINSNGFRGYDSQTYIYNEDIQNKDSEHSEYVAKPGESEHQLGLAIDITSRDMAFDLNQSFENTKEGAWVLENAYKYGFILRYTKTKEDITGYKYEPWHYRYVGNKTISKLCHNKDLTLEELLSYAKSE